MTNDLSTKLLIPAGLGVAALGIPGDLYHLTIDSRAAVADTLLFKTHGWLLVAATGLLLVVLAGLVRRIGDRLDAFGALSAAMAFTGTLLVNGNIATEAFAMPHAGEAIADPAGYWLAVIVASFGLFAAGWVGMAIAAARSGLVGWGAASVLIVGALIGFTPLPGSYLLLFAGAALVAVRASGTPAPASVPAGGRADLRG